MKHAIRNHGLSIALFSFFIIIEVGLTLTGRLQYNREREDHGKPPVTYIEYLRSSAFMEATMENWESEFLQMFAYVLLTAFLYQKGSAESKKIDEAEPVDRDPRHSRNKKGVPWPVRQGGITLKLYEYSLSIALFLLFALSFVLHAVSGARLHSEEELQHGGHAVSVTEYLGNSQFWFESFQNWQSEFFSIGVLVVLSIFLRQRGSPESKPVDSAYASTGKD